jgi:DNA-binding transcriptional LysR family regulator
MQLRQLKLAHLRLMAELASTGGLTLAAGRLGLAQPAASRLLAEVEAILGHPVHARAGRGLVLTPAGAVLARRAQRIVLELEDTGREITAVTGGEAGHVRIGAVTGAALAQVLPVLQRLAAQAPGVTTEVTVATSEVLCDLVLAGRVDVAIGRLAGPTAARLLDWEVLAGEAVALVARPGHPDLGQATLAQVAARDWVMPDDDTLLTRRVLGRLAALGLPAPPRPVRTSSFLLTLALVQGSDAVAPVSAPVAQALAAGPAPPLARLPVTLDLTIEAYGLITRADTALPPVVARVVEMVRAAPRAP